MRHALVAGLLLLTAGTATAREPGPHALSFEDRVKAQEAIERAYYSHQIGATKPFKQAVPRAVLEGKVRKYLDETAALKMYWKTAVTDEMLARELERMADGTRMPERLIEIYAALGNDAFIIKECVARATLVDRLTHDFYAFDTRIHANARRQADELHRRLVSGELSASTDVPHRTVNDLVMSEKAFDSVRGERRRQQRVTSQEFKQRRAELSATVGQASELSETRDAFVFNVILSETTTDVRVASYLVPKTSWDVWWGTAKEAVRSESVITVATNRGALTPSSGGRSLAVGSSNGAPCAPDDAWSNGTQLGGPEARGFHTAVWTGSLMIIWGGLGNTQYLNTGDRYDPATDTWSVTSTVGAPAARESHSAVWTGSEMLVWGGLSGTCLNTGGRYDPVTDTWAPTSQAGAPSARCYGQTAAWTGSYMVVWGGFGSDDMLNTGGRYDPAIDTWTPTSEVAAPSARYDHTAVWTGNSMVVWGGYSCSNSNDCRGVATGGKYDPAMNSWSPTSTMGAPHGREGHTTVWTGSEMIVWGGQGEDTGGRYDPANDSWTPTSVTGAPDSRFYHTVVWTGSVMVVWGGIGNGAIGDGGIFNIGGRYDPAFDSWRSTSQDLAPSSRFGHTAIWTGEEMIVWGGHGGVFSFRNDGGRYAMVTSPTVDRDCDGWSAAEGDCDDTRASVYPGAPQVCDGVNNDCNDPSWPAPLPNDTNQDRDHFPLCAGDCDDTNADIYPGAAESCNGVDDNCDDVTDNGGDALCDDGTLCTDDSCHGASGCAFVANTNDCNDGNACTTNDGCVGGSCQGTPVDCDDRNACTDDFCDRSDRFCDHRPNDNPCDDGNACTTNDTCNSSGQCQGGVADSDGDGVPDCEDSCLHSTPSPTVVIDSCDSGVGNHLFPGGCNFGDQIASCRAGARTHGQFVSCVVHLGNGWAGAGLITDRERSRITRCAAHSGFQRAVEF